MTTISNISTEPTIPPAPVAAQTPSAQTPSAPAVTVADGFALVTDSTGRRLKVRKLSAIDRYRLFRAAGPTDSENRLMMSYASAAAAVVEIDALPIPFPLSPIALDALIARLDEHGLVAALAGVVALMPPEEEGEAVAKN